MTDQQTIEIPFSRGRIFKTLAGALVFVLIGIWILAFQPSVGNSLFNSSLVKYGVAVVSILFFGYGLYLTAKMLADKRPALVVDRDGIRDNSNAIAVGLIPWTDVIGVSMISVMGQRFIVVSVTNPEHYISRQRNFLKRKSMQVNMRNYGSPITISTNTLKCDANELVRTIKKKLAEKAVA